MGQKLIDETGNRYGLLTVIEKTKDKNGRTAWLCRCDCGNEKIVRGTDLRKGNITTCGKGCKLKRTRNASFIDETGNRYGRLTVLKRREENSSSNKVVWICQCDCGNIVEVLAASLRNGRTTSCGCLNKEVNSERMFKDETGKKYGKLTVISLVKKSPHAIWKCLCECGNYIEVSGISLRSGNTMSCGCLQSKGELNIKNILTELNCSYKTQYTFDDLRSEKNHHLKFDFAIFSNDKLFGLIEFQGEQHFRPAEIYGGQEGFERLQKHDSKKKEYCQNHNIPLLIVDKKSDLKKEILKFITNSQEV